jgi:hypothetical protein
MKSKVAESQLNLAHRLVVIKQQKLCLLRAINYETPLDDLHHFVQSLTYPIPSFYDDLDRPQRDVRPYTIRNSAPIRLHKKGVAVPMPQP